MEVATPEPSTLDRQVRELVTGFDGLFRALGQRRPPHALPDVECSHQGMKALITLGRNGPSTMSELASQLGISLSTATHTVDRLVDKLLVERVRPADNRRVVQVALSAKGVQTHEAFLSGQLVMARHMLESLSPGEREIFLELIAKMAVAQQAVGAIPVHPS
jgi:DNA-binding MarR family transcriptional regulator